MSEQTWRPEHSWCAMALEINQQHDEPGNWVVHTFGVLDPAWTATPAAVDDLAARLAQMQAPAGADDDAWLADGYSLMPGKSHPDSPPFPHPLPTLVVPTPSRGDVANSVLGLRVEHPLVGLVSVVRGYLHHVQVEAPAGSGTEQEAFVWSHGGPDWPAEADGEAQPVVGAFCAGTDGTTAMLAHRVAAPGQDLPADAHRSWRDLTAEGPLLYASPFGDPSLVLALACGWTPPGTDGTPDAGLDDDPAGRELTPAWLAGRWWLVHVLEGLQDWRSRGARGQDIAVSGPPLELAESWEAVLADQRGPRALGMLLTDGEARHLHPLLVPATVTGRTPAQRQLWDAIAATLDGLEDGPDTLSGIRQLWDQWPALHEPDRFVGSSTSRRF